MSQASVEHGGDKRQNITFGGKVVRVGFVPPLKDELGYFALLPERARQPYRLSTVDPSVREQMVLSRPGDVFQATIKAEIGEAEAGSVVELVMFVNENLKEEKMFPPMGDLPISMAKKTFL
ncbi:hypothetical protein [Paraburkholderia phytofirmans]|uniref:hypothetical protein n=1 Tax=Paraburkholderia phytofirmans TaxID=261302 RepID=UPI0038BACFAA